MTYWSQILPLSSIPNPKFLNGHPSVPLYIVSLSSFPPSPSLLPPSLLSLLPSSLAPLYQFILPLDFTFFTTFFFLCKLFATNNFKAGCNSLIVHKLIRNPILKNRFLIIDFSLWRLWTIKIYFWSEVSFFRGRSFRDLPFKEKIELGSHVNI